MSEDVASPFAALCREYALAHRSVFLDEIRRFIRAVNNTREELSSIRAASKVRRQKLRGSGQRGRPRGAKRQPSEIAQANQIDGPESKSYDPHLGFYSSWMAAGDQAHLRPQLLDQVLTFISGADKRELAVIRNVVAKRAKRIVKKRGRPGLSDDDGLLYQARLVTWLRIIDGKSVEEIATQLYEKKVWQVRVIPPAYNKDEREIQPGNIQSIRGRLWRLENYLAAMVWDAVPASYVVPEGERRGDLQPDALEYLPLRQMIWISTGLPFRERPEECKRIVTELWPRGRRASEELVERKFAYILKKQHK